MENQDINPIPATPATPPTPGTPNTQDVMPGSIMYMVFGIVSVCICWFGWIPFAGVIFAVAGLVFGILAFKKSKKMQKEYDANTAAYKPASKAFIKVASITGLIGIILSCIFIVIAIIMSILGAMGGAYYNF